MKPGKFFSELKLDYLLQEIPLKNHASNVTNHRAVNYSDKNKNDITTHTSESSYLRNDSLKQNVFLELNFKNLLVAISKFLLLL